MLVECLETSMKYPFPPPPSSPLPCIIPSFSMVVGGFSRERSIDGTSLQIDMPIANCYTMISSFPFSHSSSTPWSFSFPLTSSSSSSSRVGSWCILLWLHDHTDSRRVAGWEIWWKDDLWSRCTHDSTTDSANPSSCRPQCVGTGGTEGNRRVFWGDTSFILIFIPVK